MATTQAIDEGLTFEKVWAALMELREIQKENYLQIKEIQQETDRQMKETDRRVKETDRQMKETDRRVKETDRQMKETDRQMKETDRRVKETDRRVKETDRQVKETSREMKETFRRMEESGKQIDKQLGELTNRFGEVVEYMVVPNLVAKFRELGFEFEKNHRDTVIKSQKYNIFTEVDAFLENGDKVMIVETKTKPKISDIDDHIERMEKLRRYADLHDDKRKYLGAIAGVVFSGSLKTYTLKKGFYVIEPSGDTFNITTPTGIYHPREW
ncbi:MAG: hypothetical protein Ta2B_08730 [Termitinemataceae bacterium]|nr:MAG: hypothetical protein Ta2B_08730 [Termitinemataceae bacterium]